MSNLDAAMVAQHAIKLGLLTENQVQEAWEETGQKGGEVMPFLLAMERKRYLTPYQSSKLVKMDPDGYFLGGYRILYKIASGSFGRVFRADDPRTGTVVALKVLRRRWSEDPHSIELFEREGKLGLALKHPNLVEIIAVSRDATTNQYYIAMEFVEGGNLRDFLTIRKKIEPAEALRLLEDAASGLAYAYSKGVTHRDMKLTNILISATGTAKVVDFGLAGLYRSARMLEFGRQEDDGQVDRTVDYAGLEKATGVEPGDVRSDIFFLGCVFYEMLTGRSPLVMTKNKLARMARERFLNTPPMTKEEVHGPQSVFRLVENMMSLNPQQRFQTPSQLLDAIRHARREAEGKTADPSGKAKLHSVFVVEKDERLQEVMREKLKEFGYRVFLATDPVRALDRFRQQPYDALVMDVQTVGEDGLLIFDRIMMDAERQGISVAGIVLLSKDQAKLAEKVKKRDSTAVVVQPTLKQLHHKLQALTGGG